MVAETAAFRGRCPVQGLPSGLSSPIEDLVTPVNDMTRSAPAISRLAATVSAHVLRTAIRGIAVDSVDGDVMRLLPLVPTG